MPRATLPLTSPSFIRWKANSVGVGTIDPAGETATRAWQALGVHQFPAVDFYSGSGPRAKNHVASFLLLDWPREQLV